MQERYVGDIGVRMGLYRRLAELDDRAGVDAFAAEMIDRFGALPEEVENLLRVLVIKGHCRQAGIEKLDAGPRGATLSFRQNQFANPAGLVDFITGEAGTARLRPDHTLLYLRAWPEQPGRLEGVERLTKELAEIAAQSPSAAAASAEA